MSENTKIEWADHTFNPWTGCTKVGPGCDGCYAESWAKRSGTVQWGPGAERRRTTPANWRLPLKWDARAKAEGRRYRVFCASLADVFDNDVPPVWRADLFELIAATPHLDWLLLTKRIGNAWKMMADACGVSQASLRLPLPNVWICATVVDQAEADRDIPKLLRVPAAVRFLSIEPMLGPIGLDCWPIYGEDERQLLHWVICGGESGANARPMHPDWARALRDQCTEAGVPFLFKQWGEWVPGRSVAEGHVIPEFQICGHLPYAEGRRVRVQGLSPNGGIVHHPMVRIGKKIAGRTLDGLTHDGFPERPAC